MVGIKVTFRSSTLYTCFAQLSERSDINIRAPSAICYALILKENLESRPFKLQIITKIPQEMM